jgi:hypothetical protein
MFESGYEPLSLPTRALADHCKSPIGRIVPTTFTGLKVCRAQKIVTSLLATKGGIGRANSIGFEAKCGPEFVARVSGSIPTAPTNLQHLQHFIGVFDTNKAFDTN